ncbi:hypothetical protein M9H77_07626 [Catharanthus roseus]|uniref:Uncharacterized protein n=1 Tax=Catharanthus roseus TaxID=4058 RepID=A0ACC0BVR1_CATRO|nr:hypothetical protein M9H77_07626 [Catharanthus roseus]
MLKLQDLQRSSCNRPSSLGRVMLHRAIYYNFFENKTLVVLSVPRKFTMLLPRLRGTGCRKEIQRHIDQNVLVKLTEMVKDEEVAQRVWISQVMHFGVETTNRAESEYSVLKLWLSTCHGDLDTEISTGPISNVREVRRLIKSVIHPVLPDDPSQPLSNPPETAVTKGRRKTNSTKRDKSHWEYVSIIHRKIGKSSGSGSGSGSGSSSGLILALVEGVGCLAVGVGAEDVAVVDRVYQPLRMIFDLRHHMRVYEQLFGSVECVTELIMQTNWEDGSAPREYWMNTPDHLYLQLIDGCPLPPLHVQWEYHQDMRVSGWATPYRNRMADWVAKYNEMYPPQRHFM